MYLAYFGLKEKPFAITPDPAYLYFSRHHAEALAHLVYGVTQSDGFIQLTGEIGTGKTTLTRRLLEELPTNVDVALIMNPALSVSEFLLSLFQELNWPIPKEKVLSKALIDTLNARLLEAHSRSRRTVLMIDEAQNLDVTVLEQLRLLTNLETNKQKLLQIILVGQPELRHLLARDELRQLAQRITARYHLGPLNQQETESYVAHRLTVAGCTRALFTHRALHELYRLSSGVPRLINILSDRALLGTYTRELPLVSAKIVRESAKQVFGEQQVVTAKSLKTSSRWPSWQRAHWPLVAAATMLIATAGVGSVVLNNQHVRNSAVAEIGRGERTTLSLPAESTTTSNNSIYTAVEVPANFRAGVTTTAVAAPSARVLPNLEELFSLSASYSDSLASALNKLFSLWNVTLEPGVAPCVQASKFKLKCDYVDASWAVLSSFNRPTVLNLASTSGEGRAVLLTALNSTEATLLVDGHEWRYPLQLLDRYWHGEALVVWQPPTAIDSLLAEGAYGPSVIWLRDQLNRIGGGSESVVVVPELYDRALANRVREFQRQNSLMVDGKVGIQTLIALTNLSSTPESSSFSSTPSVSLTSPIWPALRSMN